MADKKLTDSPEVVEEVSVSVPTEEAPKAKVSQKETKALFSSWEKAVQEQLVLAEQDIRMNNVEVVIHIGRHTPTAKEIHVPTLATAVREMK